MGHLLTAEAGGEPIRREFAHGGDGLLGAHGVEWLFGVERPEQVPNLVVRLSGVVIYPSDDAS
ncbi:MAG: hypothetical protein HYU55_05980 [Nocardioides sp.]|nr:hypothetical protein [Nocardioides sp.]